MITRTKILEEAIHKCLVTMYNFAQPSIDLDKLISTGYKDTDDNPLYKRHYLSRNNFSTISQFYKTSYGITDKWNPTFDLIIDYLSNGGLKSVYKDNHRDYEKTPSLYKYLDEEDVDIVMSLLYDCQHFYDGNRELKQFDFTMSLGVGSPTSNKESVEIYWRNNGFPDFSIEDYDIINIVYGFENPEDDINEEDFILKLRNKTPNIYGL